MRETAKSPVRSFLKIYVTLPCSNGRSLTFLFLIFMTENSILSIISAHNRNTLGKYDIFLPILFLLSFKPLKKCYCKNSPMLVTYHCYFGTMLLFFCFQMFTEDGIFLYFQFLNIPNVSEK